MKIPVSWLLSFLDTDATPAVLAEGLTRLGLEVESLSDETQTLAPFVVAHILTTQPHPNADKLQICRVETADQKDLQIVCGAPNARAGLKVVLARPGTFVAGLGITLKESAIRGVDSQGMLCSASELLLGTDSAGIIELPPETPLTTTVAQALGRDDPVLDIAITPNRGDCFGIYGVARDLAAAGLGILHPYHPEKPVITNEKPLPAVRLLAPEACPLFTMTLIEDLKNGATSTVWQQRMRAAGLKVISGVVDITNIISQGYNRPLHAFDADKIVGNLTVRLSEEGELFEGLDGVTYTLPAGALVIEDEAGIISLAGILGGQRAACDATTRRVLLESAWFQPAVIARTGQALSLTSDARMRFERGVDPQSTLLGLYHATTEIIKTCGGILRGLSAVSEDRFLPKPIPIPFNPTLVSQIAGMSCDSNEVLAILKRLGCTIDNNTITPPTWRSDLILPEDLVEEALRIIGLEALPALPLPSRSPQTEKIPRTKAISYLCNQGYHETLSFSFTSRAWLNTLGYTGDVVGLKNPISEALDVLRPSLIPNLLKIADYNARHNTSLVQCFEYGPVYPDRRQENSLALLAFAAPQKTWRGQDGGANPFDLKGLVSDILAGMGYDAEGLTWLDSNLPPVYHPNQSGGWGLGPKQPVAFVGSLHPDILDHLDGISHVAMAEIFMDRLPPKRAKNVPYQPQLYPIVSRDLAFLLPVATSFSSIKRAILKAGKPLITQVDVFDVYQGSHVSAGQKSMALRLTLQDPARTLSDEVIGATLKQVIQVLTETFGAVLRDGQSHG